MHVEITVNKFNIDDNCENEGTFKSYITEANSMMSLKVYYEGTDKEQASLKLEPFFDNDASINSA